MRSASIVYWYSGEDMRPDGGGLRITAWEQALGELGYATRVVGLWTIGGGVKKGASLSSIKRAFLPMPLKRSLPDEALDADLIVATVPAVFDDALSRVPSSKLVLDWMDLWSDAARNMGDEGRLSVIGGRAQSRLWARRERRWACSSRWNAFAGYADLADMGLHASLGSRWIPTPVAALDSAPCAPRPDHPRRRLGFIANLDYPPNELSLRAFLKRFGRRLEAQDVDLVVAGFGSDKVRSWGHGLEVLGPVDDVRDFYDDIDAVVVPIEHGSGIKVKAVEALAYGLPVFGTEHVRAGFAPEFRSAIVPIDRLFDEQWPVPTPRQALSTRFSQEAFSAEVAGLLAGMQVQ
ncbi:glycosyltransferase [Nocardioides seonyuensis]|uniref:Glycosyltransferase n=1 Tax=Nocardioides seonyuensis TaxID=2518371 RepID=A0A4P7IGI1_9ACTN|nr:glycosyltransferase [Nocardioides seonyuensis]QBX55870.1 glycosyltransferase [Nocardioides seonyuensis]